MKKLSCFISLLIIFCALISSASLRAATVTVAPSGGQYTSLFDALENFTTWRDTTEDTVEIAAGTYFINNENRPRMPGSGANTLTIRAAAGASPVFVIEANDEGNGPDSAIKIDRTGVFVIEGLTFIGEAGVAVNMGHGIFAAEVDNGVTQLTVRNCIVSANNGSNQPVLTWSAERPTVGTVSEALVSGISSYDWYSGTQVLVENCTFAFTHGGATVLINDPPDIASPALAPRTYTFNHCLIINNAGNGIQIGEIQGASSKSIDPPAVTITDSLIGMAGNRGIKMYGDPNVSSVTIQDSIIFGTGGSPIDPDSFHGSLTVERTTLYRGGGDLIQTDNNAGFTGEETIVIRDLIAGPWGAHDSVYHDRGVAPASITVDNIATNAQGGTGLRSDTSQLAKDAFAALYGSTGPLTADPMFVNETFGPEMDGRVGWDSADNNFLDVSNPAFAQKATGGSDLTGGGEFGQAVGGEPLVLIEQFSIAAQQQIYITDLPDIETLVIPEFEPTFTTVGWGGFYAGGTGGRKISIDPTHSGTSQWTGAETNNGLMNFFDSGDTEGTYIYTPELKQAIDLTVAGAKAEWDANGSFATPQTATMRILLRTATSGWVISSSITGNLGNRNTSVGGVPWTPTGGTPPFVGDMASLTWSSITNATTTPAPDLDGTAGGYADDAAALTIGGAATPDLSEVTGFGIYLESNLSTTNDLDIDAVRLTGATVGVTPPNSAQDWMIYR